MIHTFGDCPLDPGYGIPYVTPVSDPSTVLLYCPSCGSAWSSPMDVEHHLTRGLPEFGLTEQLIRFATEAEVRAAGFGISRSRAPRWELPGSGHAARRTALARGCPERRFTAILSEIDLHVVALFVVLAMPALVLRLPPWIVLVSPQGMVLTHVFDLRGQGHPWSTYFLVNEAFVMAIAGVWAFLR